MACTGAGGSEGAAHVLSCNRSERTAEMRDFTAAGLNFSLKLGLMEYASSAAGIAARATNGDGEERQRTESVRHLQHAL